MRSRLESVVMVPTRRAGAGRTAALLERHRRRQPGDLLDVRGADLVEQPAGVRRHGLEVAALRLGVQRAEGERGLARAGDPGEGDDRVAWEVDVHVAQVVLAGSPHADEAVVLWSAHPACLPGSLTRASRLGRRRRTPPASPGPERCTSPAARARRPAQPTGVVRRHAGRIERHPVRPALMSGSELNDMALRVPSRFIPAHCRSESPKCDGAQRRFFSSSSVRVASTYPTTAAPKQGNPP